jgi:hypothetical protein
MDESKMMDSKAEMISAQAKIMDASIKAQNAQGEIAMKQADLANKNIAEENKKQALKIDAANHVADRVGKIKLETMRLKQSELVHRDKLQHEQVKKDLDTSNQMAIKGLDIEEARRQAQEDRLAEERRQVAPLLKED